MDTPEEDAPDTPASEPRSSSYLEEKAFKSRTLLIFGTITDVAARDVTRRLIALDADSNAPIDILVSSPGGHLESGDAIHDVVRFIAAPRERRFCLPNTRFLIHQPSGGAGGPASDIAIHAKEIIKARERIARTISRETGKSFDAVMADIERDRWLSAEEAVEYGLVSRIIERKSELNG
jgi:ATP-dependent Clp protease protease subunit